MPTGPQAEEKDFKSAYRDIEARQASAQTPGGIDVSVGVTYGVGDSNRVSNGVGNGNGIDVSVLIPATYKETKTRMASKQKTPTHGCAQRFCFVGRVPFSRICKSSMSDVL